MYLEPDLTAENPLYKVSNHVCTVITNEQKISLRGAAHIDSINVVVLGTIPIPLVKDVDWTVRDDDIDWDISQSIRSQHPDYKKKFCKSITIIKPYVDADYKINVSHQRVYPVHGKVALFNDEPLEFTPDMLAYLLRMIDYLNSMLDPIKDVHSPDYQNPWGLEMDPHLKRPENFIAEEKHSVDVPGGKFFIHPIGGSFHKGTLVVRDLNTGNTMKENVDYKVFGFHPHKTTLTSHTGGVHEFILFLRPYVGEVEIDYHAFGGDVTIADHRILVEDLNNIIDFISQSQFVTYDNLKGAPIMADLNSQLTNLKSEVKYMRSLLSGRPSSTSNHGQILKKTITSNDTDLHWWNIASLYKVDGSDDIITADVLKIRVRTQHTVFMFDAIIALNLNAPDKKMEVSVLSPVYPKGYVPYENYDGLNHIIRPQFRCIWNENTAQGSGVLLQIGMPLKTVSQDVLVVENWSGQESCWELVPSTSEGDHGSDNVVELPAGNHYWDIENPDSRQESMLIPFDDGHIVWAGSIPLNPTSGSEYLTLKHILESDIDVTRIRRMSLDLSEDASGRYRYVIDFVPGAKKLVGSTSFLYNGRPAYLVGTIFKDENDKIQIKVDATITAGPAANPLYLRHAIIHTN